MRCTEPKSSPSRRIRRFAWAVLITVYIGAYTVLSFRGEYLGHNQGGNDNRDTWAPAYCAELYTSPPVARSCD